MRNLALEFEQAHSGLRATELAFDAVVDSVPRPQTPTFEEVFADHQTAWQRFIRTPSQTPVQAVKCLAEVPVLVRDWPPIGELIENVVDSLVGDIRKGRQAKVAARLRLAVKLVRKQATLDPDAFSDPLLLLEAALAGVTAPAAIGARAR